MEVIINLNTLHEVLINNKGFDDSIIECIEDKENLPQKEMKRFIDGIKILLEKLQRESIEINKIESEIPASGTMKFKDIRLALLELV